MRSAFASERRANSERRVSIAIVGVLHAAKPRVLAEMSRSGGSARGAAVVLGGDRLERHALKFRDARASGQAEAHEIGELVSTGPIVLRGGSLERTREVPLNSGRNHFGCHAPYYAAIRPRCPSQILVRAKQVR